MKELIMPNGSPSSDAGDIDRRRLMPDEEEPDCIPEEPEEVPYELPVVDAAEVPVVDPPVLGKVVDALPEPIAVPPSVVLADPVVPVEGVVWGVVPRGCCRGLSGCACVWWVSGPVEVCWPCWTASWVSVSVGMVLLSRGRGQREASEDCRSCLS
jgi:hypothetical protein